MKTKKAGIVFGTRPELIKLAPVIQEYENRGLRDRLWLVDTGQHADLIDEYLKVFGIVPDLRLKGLRRGQHLSQLHARLLSELQEGLDHVHEANAEICSLMAQGDTATVLSTAMIATFNRIPFFHLEAGLRSHDLNMPFPEEYNRKVAAINAHFHFAPTPSARNNLLAEGIPEEMISVTGNTVVDALLHMRKLLPSFPGHLPDWWDRMKKGKSVLITSHRRENQGQPLVELRAAVLELAKRHPSLTFLWLTHPNPAVLKVVNQTSMRGCPNVILSPPVDYLIMVRLYDKLCGILTDSGGIQEEAPTAGVPVVLLRQTVERTECIDAGYSRKALPISTDIVKQFEMMRTQPPRNLLNPYGDGKAAIRILDHLQKRFSFLNASAPLSTSRKVVGS